MNRKHMFLIIVLISTSCASIKSQENYTKIANNAQIYYTTALNNYNKAVSSLKILVEDINSQIAELNNPNSSISKAANSIRKVIELENSLNHIVELFSSVKTDIRESYKLLKYLDLWDDHANKKAIQNKIDDCNNIFNSADKNIQLANKLQVSCMKTKEECKDYIDSYCIRYNRGLNSCGWIDVNRDGKLSNSEIIYIEKHLFNLNDDIIMVYFFSYDIEFGELIIQSFTDSGIKIGETKVNILDYLPVIFTSMPKESIKDGDFLDKIRVAGKGKYTIIAYFNGNKYSLNIQTE